MKAAASLGGGCSACALILSCPNGRAERRLTKRSQKGEVLSSPSLKNLGYARFMTIPNAPLRLKASRIFIPITMLLLCASQLSAAETPAVPDWAQPGSATHKQVPPPADFHRASRNFDAPIGIFDGQSDVGGAVVPGGASYDAAAKNYTIDSAGYNIWYTRDEFRFLWKKMSGDLSLATDIVFPNPDGYGDRKVVLIVRQSLDDDSKEIMVALHGAGLIHLAQRPVKGADIKETYRTGGSSPGAPVELAKRLGIEKRGDSFALFVSMKGEPMHQVGPAAELHFDEPFYVGIGFCSHLPDKSDRAQVSDVVLKNSAGKVR